MKTFGKEPLLRILSANQFLKDIADNRGTRPPRVSSTVEKEEHDYNGTGFRHAVSVAVMQWGCVLSHTHDIPTSRKLDLGNLRVPCFKLRLTLGAEYASWQLGPRLGLHITSAKIALTPTSMWVPKAWSSSINGEPYLIRQP